MKRYTESKSNIQNKGKRCHRESDSSSNLSDSQYTDEKNQQTSINRSLRKPEVTQVLAMDCEMVSNTKGEKLLARVSIVNSNLECLYDKFVKPTEAVGDYRTAVSGVRQSDLNSGEEFSVVQKEVKELLHNKILVGHAVQYDFKVLKFKHQGKLIRDTSKFEPFKVISKGKTPSLKNLSKYFLNEMIQEGEHSSVEDARAAMKLYLKYRHDWEVSFAKEDTTLLNIF